MPKLADVARDMEEATRNGGTALRRLSRGLELCLTVANACPESGVKRQKALTLSRPDVSPSEREVRIVWNIFNVPQGATIHHGVKTVVILWPT